MKILFLTSSMEGGGAERVAALLCNAWAKNGHEVILMPTFSGHGNCSYQLNSKVELKYLADLVKGKTGRIKRLWALRKFYHKACPDIIVSFLPLINVAALLSARGTGIPVIISERTYPENSKKDIGKIIYFLRGRIYKWAQNVVVQTSDVEKWVIDNCPHSNTVIIPNPVVHPLPSSNLSNPPERWLKKNRKLILGSGRLHVGKRFDCLIEAFARIAAQYPDWDLAIVGEGSERSKLEILCKKFGLTDRIFIVGFTGNVAEWYKRADIYALTSVLEGFPNTLLEAMSYGVASVAFDIKTGPSDLITSDQTGIILPNENHVAQMAETFGQLIENQNKRNQLGQNAIYVREKYAMPNILKMWDRLLNNL